MDKLFNNTCELDNRTYYKAKLNNLDSSLDDYKEYIINQTIQTGLKESSDRDSIILTIIDKQKDYNNFDQLFEAVYREKLEAQEYNVFISGGLDSTTLYKLLKSKDIAFKPHCIRYISQGIVFNDYEIKNAPGDVNIIDFDILDFFDSGKFLETAQKYHCVTPQFLPLLKVFESIDGPILESSSAPNGSHVSYVDENGTACFENNIYVDRMQSRYLTYRYALDMRNDGSIFNFYRSHHYIDTLSTKCFEILNKKHGRSIIYGAGDWDDEYNTKAYLYKNIFNVVGKMTNKFTGFEALKVWYADKYIGNDPYLQVFDRHFREILLQRNIDKFQDLNIICILKE